MNKPENMVALIQRHASTAAHYQRLRVEFEYPVHFTRAVFDADNPVFARAVARREPGKRHRCAVFVDSGVAQHWSALETQIMAYAAAHADQLELVTAPERVAGGEAAKNAPALITNLQRRLLELAIDRHAYVVAIGGGAVLDAVGYVAATTHRGVRQIRVPTTVLAQNDAGVGVKNSVNAFGVKNFIGTFAPPFAVLNDFDFLATLEHRDKIAGMAEAVKVALIRDADFFAWLEANTVSLAAFEADAAETLVRRCAELHMQHIASSGDPFESGSARPLDFGHWAAHKLESLSAHALRHGEAVAIGMALDTRYSVLQGLLPEGHDERVCALLERLGFRLWHPATQQRAVDGKLALLGGLREFREHLGGELTVTLLSDIGHSIEVHHMDGATVERAVDWLKARDRAR